MRDHFHQKKSLSDNEKLDKKLQSYKFGLKAEKLVKLYLFFRGYKILESRYTNKLGEIDIVCFKNNTLIAIEVKARKASLSDSAEVLTTNQMQRITRSLNLYLSSHKKFKNCSLRFDLILYSGIFSFKHVKNAW